MKNRTLILLTIILLIASSCDKDFEEINVNPSQPTSTFMEAIFNGVVESLQLTWDGQFYVDNEILYPMTQLGALTSNQWSNTALGIDAIWKNYYETLKNIRELERRFESYPGEQEELVNVKAMTKILLAYKTFKVTDLFGDIPFSEAGYGNIDLDLLKPKFDSQESIYKFLLEELEWASNNIVENTNILTSSGKPIYSFGSYDALFNGNPRMWVKFANSLRLRYAMRIVNKERELAEEIIGDILNNDRPLITKGEDVVLRPALLGYSKLSTHWSFREHKNLRMGSTVWNALNGSVSTNRDPRLALFFDTNNENQWQPYPNFTPDGESKPTEGGIPYGGQRDEGYAIKGVDNLYSSFQYYLIRDEDHIPEVLLTASEVGFHKAEAILRGIGVAQDNFLAETEYATAISNSIQFWHDEAQNSAIWEQKPEITSAEINNYPWVTESVTLSQNNFDIDLIYKQEWLCYLRQPWEAFALMRRTMQTPYEGDPLKYFRLVYPASEVNNNFESYQEQINGMTHGDSNSEKVWWMD